MPTRFDVITLFPQMFAGVLGGSILDRAARSVPDPAAPDDPARVRPPVASYHLHQLRDFSADAKHGKVDKPPYGGGAGMVLQCQPLWDAVKHVEAIGPDVKPHRVFVTPTGRPLTQRVAEELATQPRLLIVCGHYEGFDQRVLDALHEDGGLDEISVGDVVLSGGELPAMTLIDAVVRLLPGALGDADSHRHDSFSPGVDRLLDHPHYTHPPVWEGREVPGVLRSGDHGKVAAWRAERSRELTEARRPDLLPGGGATDARGAPALIREATEGDRRAILGVYADVFGADDAETKRVASLLNTHEAVCSWVAEIGGEVVGHAMVTDAHLVEESGRRGLVALRPIVVRSSHRRRGLGGALARRTIDEARCLAGILLAPVPAGGVAKEGWLNAWAKSLGLEAGVALGFWTQEADTDLWAMRLRTTAEPGQGEVAWP